MSIDTSFPIGKIRLLWEFVTDIPYHIFKILKPCHITFIACAAYCMNQQHFSIVFPACYSTILILQLVNSLLKSQSIWNKLFKGSVFVVVFVLLSIFLFFNVWQYLCIEKWCYHSIKINGTLILKEMLQMPQIIPLTIGRSNCIGRKITT